MTEEEPAQQEPIYQYQMANGSWIDQTKESHDYNVRHGQATVRVVYTSPPAQQEPVAWEPLTDSQIMASVGRHWGGEKTSISQSRPVGQQWEQICELVRCVIRERYTSPPAQQEPVAWRWSESNGQRWFDWTTDWSHHDKAKSMGVPIEYAYTSTPAQRKPLTPEWIWIWLMDWCKRNGTSPANYDSLFRMVSDARAIEAAHNIKEHT